MKNFAFQLLLLVATFLSPVAAFGGRAAAEEMSYWYMYLLEGAQAGIRTVAPGCAAWAEGDSANDVYDKVNKVCTLKGFLKYIWAPMVQYNADGTFKYINMEGVQYQNTDGTAMSLDDILTNERPEGAIGAIKSPFAWRSISLTNVYNSIFHSPYIAGADPDRLLPSAGGDYWTARSQVTAALPAIEAQYPDDPNNTDKTYKQMRQLIAQTKIANQIAYTLRLRDFESFRIGQGGLLSKLQAKITDQNPTIKTKKVDTMIGSLGKFNALDTDATIAANTGIENFQTTFVETCQEYREADANHWTALQSARQALEVANCHIPGGGTLKRSLSSME